MGCNSVVTSQDNYLQLEEFKKGIDEVQAMLNTDLGETRLSVQVCQQHSSVLAVSTLLMI